MDIENIHKSNLNSYFNFDKEGKITLRVCSFNKIDTYNELRPILNHYNLNLYDTQND